MLLRNIDLCLFGFAVLFAPCDRLVCCCVQLHGFFVDASSLVSALGALERLDRFEARPNRAPWLNGMCTATMARDTVKAVDNAAGPPLMMRVSAKLLRDMMEIMIGLQFSTTICQTKAKLY